jgi:hypothetical protein
MAKSNRSRNDICDSGGHFNPTAARMSEVIDCEGREPEYAEKKIGSVHKVWSVKMGPYTEELAGLQG